MRLLTGPPGSGKTYQVLERVRYHLATGSDRFRLLSPTATMAEHLRHQLAREGHLVRPRTITTLGSFIEPWVEGTAQPPPAALVALADRALEELRPPEFAAVAGLRGFARTVARLVDELAMAGLGRQASAAEALAGTRYGAAFARVFDVVREAAGARGWRLRAERLAQAARALGAAPALGVDEVLADGFFTLAGPELDVLEALARHADLTVTLPDWPGAKPARERLLELGLREVRLEARRTRPAVQVTAPATVDQEAEEVARRLWMERDQGRPWREMAVVVRSPETYEGALRKAFARLAIPARFHFAAPLAGHPMVRYWQGLIEAMLGGWDHAAVLELLASRYSSAGATPAGDRFDFEVRATLPGRGLEALRHLNRNPRIDQWLEKVADLEKWRGIRLEPRQWAARLGRLEDFRVGRATADGVEEEQVRIWRSEIAGAEAFHSALETAAAALGEGHAIPLEAFWRVAARVIAETPLRVADRRRNVVHVIDVVEARQWELPVVCVCGNLEGEFPRHHGQDLIFRDAERLDLRPDGLSVRTSADREAEEQFLFEIATTRATATLVLTYPRFNARGDENLPSFLLEAFLARHGIEPYVPVRVARQPERDVPAPPPTVLAAPDLRAGLRARHATIRVTALESFLQCPFQFFARRTLGLEEPPRQPADRLDPRVLGTIAHEVLAAWEPGGEPLEALVDRLFDQACREVRVPAGWRREALRAELLRNLEGYAANPLETPPGWNVHRELTLEFELRDGTLLRGRLDRCEQGPVGEAVVVDFKYSAPAGTKKNLRKLERGLLIQGGIYLLAAERQLGLRPSGFLYCGLKQGVTKAGWLVAPQAQPGVTAVSAEELRARLAVALEAAEKAVAGVLDGRIAPAPADPESCAWCEFRDGCRVEEAAEPVARPAVWAGEEE
jgi:RecB family exonuclease